MTKEEISLLEKNEWELSQQVAEVYNKWMGSSGIVSIGFSKLENYNEGQNPYYIAVDRLAFEKCKVQCDSELNTPEVIERNELIAKITVNSDPIPLFVLVDFMGIQVSLPVIINELKDLPKAQSVFPEGFEVKHEFGAV